MTLAKRQRFAAVLSLVVLGAALAASMLLGASELTPSALGHALWTGLMGGGDDTDAFARLIFLSIRLPRTLTAAICGAALASAGVVSQGLFRNPLASPSVLGSEAGGSAAAVVAFFFGAAYWHWLTLPVAAFIGALAATAFIFRLATHQRVTTLESLLLAGFAVNAFAGALTSLSISLALEDYQKSGAMMHWLLGGFGAKGWEHVGMSFVPVCIGLGCAWYLAPRLDVVALGEDVATTLSIDIKKLRHLSIVAAALLVGAAVAVAGAIPFVGLVVPHFTRLAFGPRHRSLLFFSAVNGMSLTLLADLVARTVRAPAELEVGILTSLIGAPFFLWLLINKRRRLA